MEMKRITGADAEALMALLSGHMRDADHEDIHPSYEDLTFEDGWSEQLIHSCPANMQMLEDTDTVRFNRAGAVWNVAEARDEGVFQQQFMFQLKERKAARLKLQKFYAIAAETMDATFIGEYPEMADAVGAWVRSDVPKEGPYFVMSFELLEKIERAMDVANERRRS